MSFTFSFEICGPIVQVTIEGRMDQNGALAVLESFTSDPAFRPEFGICYDVRMNHYFPAYLEVMSFSHEYGRRFRRKIKGKVAFIVNSNVQFGIARMATTILSSILPQMEIFRTKEEGLHWLRS
jgi:hypothetical protein